MNAKTLLAIGLACVIGAAQAEDAEEAATETPSELQKTKDRLAMLTAQNEIMAAKFGAAATPKTGAVSGQEHLLGMANEHLPVATEQVGKAIGADLLASGCAETVIVDNASITDKVALALNYSKQIEQLREEINKALAGTVRTTTVPALLAVAGGVVSVAGLFKTDYALSGTALTVDQDWLIASIISGNDKLTADRFPDRTVVDKWLDVISHMKSDVGQISDAKKKKELAGKVKLLEAALLKPDDKGMLPLVTLAFYDSLVGKTGKCVAIISSTAASPILLTKSNLWSKGAKAFLYMPVQASVVVISNLGRPVGRICKVSTVYAPIKLSALTNANEQTKIPWSGKEMKGYEVATCGEGLVWAKRAVSPTPQVPKNEGSGDTGVN